MDAYTMMAINMLNNSLTNASNMLSVAGSKGKDRKFMKEMYEKQVATNRENWVMQNEYNAPSAQMERLVAANLNPNLVYGSGAVANSANAPQGASANSGGYSRAPEFKAFSMFADYMQARQLDLQNKKVEAEVEGMRLDNDYKAQTLDDRVTYQTALKDRLVSLSLIASDEREIKAYEREAKADIANIRNLILHGDKTAIWTTGGLAQTDGYMADLKRSPLYAAVQGAMLKDGLTPALMSAKLDILEYELAHILPEKLRGMQADNAIKEVEADMWKQGINPRDPVWMRVIAMLLSRWLDVDITDLPDIKKLW